MESMASQGDNLQAPLKTHKHTTLISILENDSSTCLSNDFPLYKYQGFWYVGIYLEGILEFQELDPSDFNLSPSDIIICSCMKSGTTWLKALAFSIATRTRFDPFSKDHPLFSSVPHGLIPFIEIDIAQNRTPRDPELPLLSTHMNYSALPESISSFGCKIVYICRNPKDVFVSTWHFMHKVIPKKEPLPLEKAFDLFCKGISLCGPYWDHVLEYWKASLDHPDRILFLKYEDMMDDTELYARKLAEFMGYPFSSEEERDGVVKRIVKMCSFGSLSNLEVNKTGRHREERVRDEDISVANSSFFRKGKVDDWRNYLTEEMRSKLDQITIEKLANSGLTLE